MNKPAMLEQDRANPRPYGLRKKKPPSSGRGVQFPCNGRRGFCIAAGGCLMALDIPRPELGALWISRSNPKLLIGQRGWIWKRCRSL
jgi:hypothetical protein